MLSAIDRNTVRLQSESVAAFVGIRSEAAVIDDIIEGFEDAI